MDPYVPPVEEVHSTIEYNAKNIEDHPTYEFILMLVLTGEKKDFIYEQMSSKGISSHVADLIFNDAKSFRVQQIRSHYVKKFFFGIPAIVFGISLFCVFWFVIGLLPKIVLAVCSISIAFGLWKCADGIAGYLSAKSRIGEISHIIN